MVTITIKTMISKKETFPKAVPEYKSLIILFFSKQLISTNDGKIKLFPSGSILRNFLVVLFC